MTQLYHQIIQKGLGRTYYAMTASDKISAIDNKN